SPDDTFGQGGRVITTFPNGSSEVGGLALQPDGKILAAGRSARGFALARYLDDGSLDLAFGEGGTVTTSFGPNRGSDASALALQDDGKIVVAGTAGGSPSFVDYDFALARYNTDGTLDESFGVGGLVTTGFGSSYDIAYSVVLQPDGRIVAAGQATINGYRRFALARYHPDGNLDYSFGLSGQVVTGFA